MNCLLFYFDLKNPQDVDNFVLKNLFPPFQCMLPFLKRSSMRMGINTGIDHEAEDDKRQEKKEVSDDDKGVHGRGDKVVQVVL